jgi:polyhydroxybutyrate depolymerase
VLLVACGGDSDSNGDAATPVPSAVESAACGAAGAREPGEFDETIASGGIERAYILHVPPSYDGTQETPLVLLFHGFALTGRIMLDYAELGALADREGFLVVSPTGTGDPPRWNQTATPGGADDVLFVNDLLDRLNGELCIDQERTFATGYSNGGGMSMRLACDESDRIRAVGLVAAVFLDCTPKVPLIAFHGTEDPLVSFEGGSGPGGSFPAIREGVAAWATALACDTAPPDVTSAGEHVELTVYDGCSAGDGAAQLYVVDGGGHTWPGATLFGDRAATTQEIDASELIWQFFSGR